MMKQELVNELIAACEAIVAATSHWETCENCSGSESLGFDCEVLHALVEKATIAARRASSKRATERK